VSDPSGWWAIGIAGASLVASLGSYLAAQKANKLGGPLVAFSDDGKNVMGSLTYTTPSGPNTIRFVTVRNGGRGDVTIENFFLVPAVSWTRPETWKATYLVRDVRYLLSPMGDDTIPSRLLSNDFSKWRLDLTSAVAGLDRRLETNPHRDSIMSCLRVVVLIGSGKMSRTRQTIDGRQVRLSPAGES
jgi:hypothetical protein